MKRAPTLRGRVSLLGLAVIAGWLFILAAGFDIVLSHRLDQQIDDALEIRAQAASATVAVSDRGITGVRESATDSALDNSIWIYRGRTALERPRAPRNLQSAADELSTRTTSFVDRAGHRLHVLPVRAGGRRVGAVVAAVDLAPYERTRNTAILGSIVVAVLLLGGVYPALRYVAGRALRPVEAMSAKAAEWSSALPIRRFGEGERYAELQQLAANLDELLGRLGASLRHERHLSAELSHELRTPLARIIMQIDLMSPAATDDVAVELAELRQECEAMNRIIDSLLAAARTELSSTTGHASLATVLSQFRAKDPPIGDSRADLDVDIESTSLLVGVDGDVVVRILAPIVENARRYAASLIRVTSYRDDANVVVEIANDGPPVRAADVERIFAPGARHPGESRDPADREHSGAGLGLALSRRIARSADGDVTVALNRPLTTFVVTLPTG